jgi:hypothetical protein
MPSRPVAKYKTGPVPRVMFRAFRSTTRSWPASRRVMVINVKVSFVGKG